MTRRYFIRSRSLIFGLGHGITNTDSIIPGAKLPSGRQVLRCMMYTQFHAEGPG